MLSKQEGSRLTMSGRYVQYQGENCVQNFDQRLIGIRPETAITPLALCRSQNLVIWIPAGKFIECVDID